VTVAPNFAFGLCLKRIRDEELAGCDLSSLRLFLDGAEAIAPETLRRFAARFARFGLDPGTLLPVYGLSEASLAVTFSRPGRGLRTSTVDSAALTREGRATPGSDRELVSVGAPVPGIDVRVVGEPGAELPDGRVGRVEVRGASVMARYLGARATALRDGWLDSGDLGVVVDGELHVCGRAKDVVILRGANHAPQEFEEALQGLSGAREGCAVACGFVPIGGDGEELLLLVERSGPLDGEAVRARVVERTGVRPHTVGVLEPGTLPRTSSGKLRRGEALRQFLDGSLRPPRRATRLFVLREALASVLALARLRIAGEAEPEGRWW
jgi:acyl-CoA synthetase (AMP-forming)/AMP-acid ligase II